MDSKGPTSCQVPLLLVLRGSAEVAEPPASRVAGDLDLFETPWIGSPTMEWRNHAISEQPDEIKTRPPDNHKDDPVAETNEGCCTEMSWRSKVIDAPNVVCEVSPSVPHFEGKEDI